MPIAFRITGCFGNYALGVVFKLVDLEMVELPTANCTGQAN